MVCKRPRKDSRRAVQDEEMVGDHLLIFVEGVELQKRGGLRQKLIYLIQ